MVQSRNWKWLPAISAEEFAEHIEEESFPVLPRPYKFDEARVVFLEMIDVLCADMYRKNLIARVFTWWISFDWKSLEECPNYDWPRAIDFYGRLHPKHTNGTVRFIFCAERHFLVSPVHGT